MDTLHDLYGKIVSDKKWNYYSLQNSIISNIHDISNHEYCKEFIKQMIKVSGKEATPFSDYIDDLDEQRLKHIVSCFFLGHVFYGNFPYISKHINSALDKIKLKNDLYEQSKDKFSYIWFLCCLFHDLGYVIEGNDKHDDKLNIPSKNKVLGIPKIYSKKNIERYKHYRHCICSKNDHGIYGGSIFYEEMCKLRKEKQHNEKQHNENSLYWGEDLEQAFINAAWVIICHNIFFVNKGSRATQYESYGLNDFIVNENERKITFAKHPLLFFFCLIDSLEPLKLSSGDIDIFSEISIASNFKNSIELQVQEQYIKEIERKIKWLANINQNNTKLTITIK